MKVPFGVAAIACAVLCSGGCRDAQRSSVDSAAGVAGSPSGNTLSLVDVETGRHVDANRKIADATDDFAPTDTVYASVHTSGKATAAPVMGRWTFEDGTVIDEKTDTVTTDADAYSAFFIVKPTGLPSGKYTIHVLVNGAEVQSKDVTVK